LVDFHFQHVFFPGIGISILDQKVV